jgi:hypothetical protein
VDAGGFIQDEDAAAAFDGAAHETPVDSSIGGAVAPACTVTAAQARCNSREVVTVGTAADPRRVYWAQPTQPAPSGGYPAVILYQGSFIGPSTTWGVELPTAAAFGGYYQVKLVAALLVHGFVVIQPEAQGGTFWSTNTAAEYARSVDGIFIPLLLDAIAKGTSSMSDGPGDRRHRQPPPNAW